MTLEVQFPLELVVAGFAVSSGASSQSRQRWQHRLRTVARTALEEGYWLTPRPVAVTIFYFPDAPMEGDIDNIVKPVLDAFSNVIYFDDRQVSRVLVQRFEPGDAFTFDRATPRLLECAEMSGPRIYIRVDDASLWMVR